ncbi:MAG: hypothetical protein CMD01_03920 [Flavobacteriales bacterium]|nr:hypothetical protein [Flavobacteriales bacterium]
MYRTVVILLLIAFAGVLSFNVFQQFNNSLVVQQDVLEVLPKNPAVIIESNNLRKAWSEFSETNLLWNKFFSSKEFNHYERRIKELDSMLISSNSLEVLFKDNKTVLSVYFSNQILELFGVVNCRQNQFLSFSSLCKEEALSIDTFSIENNTVFECQLKDSSLIYLSYKVPFLMYSSSKELIKEAYFQLSSDSSLLDDEIFRKLRFTASPSSNLHLYFKGDKLSNLLSFYMKDSCFSKIDKQVSSVNWMELDVDVKPNSILFSGVSSNKEDLIFQSPVAKHQSELIPDRLTSLARRSVVDFSQLINTTIFDSVAVKCNCEPLKKLKKVIGEQAVAVSFKDNFNSSYNAFFIEENGHLNAPSIIGSLVDIDSTSSELNDWKIYHLKNADFLKLMGFDVQDKQYFFTISQGYIIVSSLNGLAHIYSDWIKAKENNKQTMYNKFSKQFLSSQASIERFYSGEKGFKALSNSLKTNHAYKLSNLKSTFDFIDGFAYEFSPIDSGYFHYTMALSTGNSKNKKSNFLWVLELDSIYSSPQLMKNHRTNTKEILVQDYSNAIHLISAAGRIKWTVQLDGKIIGKVKQVDLYKNGKWQMVFNTTSKLHFLDINGNEVFGKPILLDHKATSPVAVIDYDKNLNYRFIVSCANKKVYNYNSDGKKVKGWNLFNTKGLVKSQVQFFSIMGKDYLMVNDNLSNTYLLNRKGKERFISSVKVYPDKDQKIHVIKGPSIEQTKVVFVDSLRKINSISLGAKEFSSIRLDSNCSFKKSVIFPVAFSRNNVLEYVFVCDKKLAIYGPEFELVLFENFNFDVQENISLIGNNNNYILVGSNKLKQLYLFDSNLNGYSDFPVQGTMKTCFGDLNNDGYNELITVTDGKLITYTISNEAF